MIKWSFIYGLPSAALLFALVWFLLLLRAEWTRTVAWLSIVCGAIPALTGIWALTHTHEMAERAATDFRLEHTSVFFGFAGFVAAIFWLRRSRQAASWTTMAASLYLGILWFVVIRLAS